MQLCLKRNKGGLSLINVEFKTKALFMQKLLFQNVDNIMVACQDFLFHEKRYLAITIRNMKGWGTSQQFPNWYCTNSKNDLPTVASS
jgi:hypothetical protein